MSNRTLSIDDRTYDYICDVSINESELLHQLRKETAQLDYSVMQISPEQGQFMSLLGAKVENITCISKGSPACFGPAVEMPDRLS